MTRKILLMLAMLTLVLIIAPACFSGRNPAPSIEDGASAATNRPTTVESLPSTVSVTATTAMASIERYRMR